MDGIQLNDWKGTVIIDFVNYGFYKIDGWGIRKTYNGQPIQEACYSYHSKDERDSDFKKIMNHKFNYLLK